MVAAKSASELAQQAAVEKMDAFALLGLEGVVQKLSGVADTMSTVVAELGTADAVVGEAVTGLAGVTDTTNLTETMAALDAANGKLATAGRQVAGAGPRPTRHSCRRSTPRPSGR